LEAAESEGLEPASAQNTAKMSPVDVTITELTPEKLMVQISAHPPGHLVIAEMFYPGWHADIDDMRIPVQRCNSILRCLRLEGSAVPVQIRLEFRPAAFRLGLVVSVVTLGLIILGFIYSRPISYSASR